MNSNRHLNICIIYVYILWKYIYTCILYRNRHIYKTFALKNHKVLMDKFTKYVQYPYTKNYKIFLENI